MSSMNGNRDIIQEISVDCPGSGLFGRPRVSVLAVGFDAVTAEESIARALEIIGGDGEKSYVVTPNPEIVWMARRIGALRDAINSAGIVLADGIGIILAGKILKTPMPEKIPGIDFASALLGRMASSGRSVYLLGAKPGVAEKAAENLMKSYPELRIAGAADGYFTDDAPVIERINAARPDVLLVCLGAPKRELWMSENLEKLDVRLCAGLGGSLDVFAGEVKRAPAFFRKLELEWFYRLITDPRRIKRMIKLPLFLISAALSKKSK